MCTDQQWMKIAKVQIEKYDQFIAVVVVGSHMKDMQKGFFIELFCRVFVGYKSLRCQPSSVCVVVARLAIDINAFYTEN